MNTITHNEIDIVIHEHNDSQKVQCNKGGLYVYPGEEGIFLLSSWDGSEALQAMPLPPPATRPMPSPKVPRWTIGGDVFITLEEVVRAP